MKNNNKKLLAALLLSVTLMLMLMCPLAALAETPAPVGTAAPVSTAQAQGVQSEVGTKEADEDETEAIATPTGAKTELKISPDSFLASLVIMGKGLLGIFVVTIVIMLVIAILNKATNKKNSDAE